MNLFLNGRIQFEFLGVFWFFLVVESLWLYLEKSNVLQYLAANSEFLNQWSLVFILLVVIVVSLFATELMSNLALVSVLVPLVAVLAIQMGYDVFQLTIPLTLAASCAFMMPVSTPPNAIVFSSGKITIAQMASIGFCLNIIAVLTLWGYCFFLLHKKKRLKRRFYNYLKA